MSFNRKTVRERYAASRRMAGLGPVPRFQQDRVEHSGLHYFAGHSVDLHPIAQSNPVSPHQHEPSDKPNDEILQRDGESRAGKPKESSQLIRRTKNDQQHEKHCKDL